MKSVLEILWLQPAVDPVSVMQCAHYTGWDWCFADVFCQEEMGVGQKKPLCEDYSTLQTEYAPWTTPLTLTSRNLNLKDFSGTPITKMVQDVWVCGRFVYRLREWLQQGCYSIVPTPSTVCRRPL